MALHNPTLLFCQYVVSDWTKVVSAKRACQLVAARGHSVPGSGLWLEWPGHPYATDSYQNGSPVSGQNVFCQYICQ